MSGFKLSISIVTKSCDYQRADVSTWILTKTSGKTAYRRCLAYWKEKSAQAWW